jgi:hypothetical protein
MRTRISYFCFLAAAVLAVGGLADGAPIYSSGSATIGHDAGGGGDPAPVITTVSSLPGGETLQYAEHTITKTVGNETSTSTAAEGIWQITFPSACGLVFHGDTGVDQYDTAGLFGGAASLSTEFSATWTIDAWGYGPLLCAGAIFGVAGTVGDGGGWVKMLVTASFDSAQYGSLRSAIGTPFFFDDTPGAFYVSPIADYKLCIPTALNPGDTLTISGTVTLLARSGTVSGSSIEFPGVAGQMPEPTVLGLMAAGGGLLSLVRRRRP